MGHEHGRKADGSKTPGARARLAPVDRRMAESDLTPNELDQTDESQKASDITHSGEGIVRDAQLGPDCPGETPQSSTPCAPDGKSADRYAG